MSLDEFPNRFVGAEPRSGCYCTPGQHTKCKACITIAIRLGKPTTCQCLDCLKYDDDVMLAVNNRFPTIQK